MRDSTGEGGGSPGIHSRTCPIGRPQGEQAMTGSDPIILPRSQRRTRGSAQFGQTGTADGIGRERATWTMRCAPGPSREERAAPGHAGCRSCGGEDDGRQKRERGPGRRRAGARRQECALPAIVRLPRGAVLADQVDAFDAHGVSRTPTACLRQGRTAPAGPAKTTRSVAGLRALPRARPASAVTSSRVIAWRAPVWSEGNPRDVPKGLSQRKSKGSLR